MKQFILIVFLGFFLSLSLSQAQASTAGSACPALNAVERDGGQTLICNGTVWKLAEAVSSGGKTQAQIDNDTGACTADKLGRLRYDGISTWEYCNGTAWVALAPAAGGSSFPACSSFPLCSAANIATVPVCQIPGNPSYCVGRVNEVAESWIPALNVCAGKGEAGGNWHLPTNSEYLSVFAPNRVAIGGFANQSLITSSETSATSINIVNVVLSGNVSTVKYGAHPFRCIRHTP